MSESNSKMPVPEKELRAVTGRKALRWAAVKLGEVLLFIVLLAAGLWIVLFLVKLSGWWPWFESGPDGPVAAATLSALAVLLTTVAVD